MVLVVAVMLLLLVAAPAFAARDGERSPDPLGNISSDYPAPCAYQAERSGAQSCRQALSRLVRLSYGGGATGSPSVLSPSGHQVGGRLFSELWRNREGRGARPRPSPTANSC